jgi:citronellol/citronellal dehydrogenase
MRQKPEIVADAALIILTGPIREHTGNYFMDDEVLASAGVTEPSRYPVMPGTKPLPDIFLA